MGKRRLKKHRGKVHKGSFPRTGDSWTGKFDNTHDVVALDDIEEYYDNTHDDRMGRSEA